MQKLELTWIGKGQEPAVEPRILLHDPSRDYGDPSADNMLIHGDNLLALKALEQEFAGQVKCVYIDPPYNVNAMNEHFYKEEISYKAANMRPFTRIEPSFGGKFKTDEIYDLRAPLQPSEVKSKIFSGFKKAGHTLYKFDSDTERTFAIVLENDNAVLRWLRPAPRQFSIYWGRGGARKYEPDFIVETAETIYMCEPKASRNIQDADVLEKKEAAEEYCRAATEFNAENGGKPWRYLLISHDDIRLNSSFVYLVKSPYTQQKLN